MRQYQTNKKFCIAFTHAKTRKNLKDPINSLYILDLTSTGVVYAYFAFNPDGSYGWKTYKWSIVFREEAKSPNTVLSYQSYACVGNLDMVTNCLNTLVNL